MWLVKNCRNLNDTSPHYWYSKQLNVTILTLRDKRKQKNFKTGGAQKKVKYIKSTLNFFYQLKLEKEFFSEDIVILSDQHYISSLSSFNTAAKILEDECCVFVKYGLLSRESNVLGWWIFFGVFYEGRSKIISSKNLNQILN